MPMPMPMPMLMLMMKRLYSDLLVLLLIGGVAIALLKVGVPHAAYDSQRSLDWTLQWDVDDGLNADRAASILTYKYRNNPVLPVGQQQLHLAMAALGSRFAPAFPTLEMRALYTLRVQSVVAFVIAMFCFFIMLRQLFPTGTSFLVWLVWFTSGGYKFVGVFKAKEDTLCLVFVLSVFALWISYCRNRRDWKLLLSAVLIGLGASTKQYPILMVFGFLPLVLHSARKTVSGLFRDGKILRQVAKRVALLLLISLGVFVIANPNFYLGSFSPRQIAGDFVFHKMTRGGGFAASALHSLRIFWSVFVVHLFEVWLGIGLIWLVVSRIERLPHSDALAPSWKAARDYKWWIALFLAIYYAVSLYKQHQFVSPKYYIVGEVVAFLLLGAVFERALAISEARLRYVVLVALLSICGLRISQGLNGLAQGFGALAEDFRAGAHSTADEIEGVLAQATVRRTDPIVADFYTYLPRDRYDLSVHWGITREIVAARKPRILIVNGSGRGYYGNEPQGIYQDLDQRGSCYRLLKKLEPKADKSGAAGVLGAYQNLLEVIDKVTVRREPMGAAGGTFWIYDSSACTGAGEKAHS